MALQVWLPLNGDLHNQGLSGDLAINNNGATVDNSGKIGKCYSFNGSQYITLPTSVLSNFINEISVCAWVNITAWNSSYDSIIKMYAGSNAWNNSIFAMGRNNTASRLYFSIANGSSSTQGSCTLTTDQTTNTWYHIACVYNYTDKNMKIYLNGELKVTYATTIVPNFSSVTSIGIGGSPLASYGLKGKLNDVRIYNHALSPKEVEEIAKGLVLHYKLDNNGIGGDNLFTNSSLQSKVNNFPSVSSSYTQTFENNDGYNCFHIHSDNFGVGSSMGWNMASVINSYPIGTKFTVSGWVKTENITKGTTNYFCQFYYGGSYNNNGTSTWIGEGSRVVQNISSDAFTRSGTGWTYCYITSTFTRNDYTNMSFLYYLRDFKGDIYLRDFKFEVGSQPTAWSPAKTDTIYPASYKTTVFDSSGYSNNGTISGSLTAAAGSPKYNVATQFPDSDCSISIGNLSTLVPDGNFTFNIWFKKKTGEWSSKTWETILGGPSGFEFEGKLSSSTNAYIHPYSWGGGSTSSPNSYSIAYTLDEWHMVTMVRTASNTQFYLDGEFKVTGTAGTIPSGDYFIGSWRNATSQNFRGYFSDARIYATALTAAQVAELYKTSMLVDSNENRTPRSLEA